MRYYKIGSTQFSERGADAALSMFHPRTGARVLRELQHSRQPTIAVSRAQAIDTTDLSMISRVKGLPPLGEWRKGRLCLTVNAVRAMRRSSREYFPEVNF